MNKPLVTVICLCYNQARFVAEAIESVFAQTYENIELIVVDDASTDESKAVIEKVLHRFPGTSFISLPTNLGNCRAFNRGWLEANGDFIIDFAADDVLLPHRVELGVKEFLLKGIDYGVHFGDAQMVDEQGALLGLHSDRFPHATIPTGDIYQDLIERYFINGPSMMVRREVFEKLRGYDETLHYEDFDFWIRSSRYFRYFYTPQVLVKNRKVAGSMSQKQMARGSQQQQTTFAVLKKIETLNRTRQEHEALRRRLRYEFFQRMRRGDWLLATRYLKWWLLLG